MTSSYLSELQPSPRVLLGPGPSSVHPRVLQAMTLPVVGHLDPEFFQVMDQVGDMLREIYHTSNFMTLPLSCTGTGAMEAACANILERGDTMVVCRNGFFGDRLADIAERCGADTYVVDSPWGKPADPAALAQELDKHPNVKAVGVVHAETSTGVLTPLQEMIDLAHRHGALVVVDAVTSLGSHEMRMDDWDIDVCYSASQKCLGAPPGLAPISFGPRAMDVINTRKTKVQSFYFNIKDLESYWSQTRAYHHTSPISMTYALREALRMLMEEGLENRIQRHARVASSLRAGLKALGIGVLADEANQLNPLTGALVPEGVDDAAVRRALLDDYNIEIGGGLGELRGKIWRIGLMGDSARETNVFALLSALEIILSNQGYEVAQGSSLAAAQQALAEFGRPA
ncbi:MAG: alanine--glyoxylate aminotransferase family protein [Chloroflexi bacterium]|nr:alanine--glyoxylate aminotransferase family protein [Chloroflexota bacterium]MCH8350956.1 alanine--glyoxylate aminotransferase family protein [Chloroflexota bacterium]MCI0785429.1 alanine--glyoxylate aminotransferase family protein [Chloroflexota bacterium]MCI0793741.1 alanine--glyoxylate aminotransferase family protein [Chloroflexota bacterium]MCI0798849.1 alanine--glyoxylate aminotransferase family protein [Chloroflexota bacterium]